MATTRGHSLRETITAELGRVYRDEQDDDWGLEEDDEVEIEIEEIDYEIPEPSPLNIEISDMTIQQVINHAPTEIVSKQKDVASFNKLMSDLSNMMMFGMNHISEYKYLDVFPLDISHLETNDLNKMLFDYENDSREAEPEDKLVPSINRKSILRAAREGEIDYDKRHHTNELRRLRTVTDNANEEIQAKLRRIKNCWDAINRFRCEVHAAEQRSEIIRMQMENNKNSVDKGKLKLIRSIPSDYILLKADKDYFYIVNSEPVIIREINPAAGINRSLYLGYFKFRFNWELSEVITQRFADSHNYGGAAHPHFSDYICWGNLHDGAMDAINNKDTAKLFSLMQSLLTTYNRENPFSEWDNYDRNKTFGFLKDFEDYPEIFKMIYERSDSSNLFKATYEKLTNPKLRAEINTFKRRYTSEDEPISTIEEHILQECRQYNASRYEESKDYQQVDLLRDSYQQLRDRVYGSSGNPINPFGQIEEGETRGLSHVQIIDLLADADRGGIISNHGIMPSVLGYIQENLSEATRFFDGTKYRLIDGREYFVNNTMDSFMSYQTYEEAQGTHVERYGFRDLSAPISSSNYVQTLSGGTTEPTMIVSPAQYNEWEARTT